MSSLCKHIVATALLALAVVVGAQEKQPDEAFDAIIGGGKSNAPDVLYGEVVDDVYAPRISSFRVIDNQRVLIYTTPFRPYLLTLVRRAPGLDFEERLALKYNNSRIYARFDAVVVNGIPHAIRRIEKLDKETAKSLTRREKKNRKDDRPVETPAEAGDKEETGSAV